MTASQTNPCDPSRRPADAGAVLFALIYPTLLTCVFFVALADRAAAVQQTVFLCGKTLQFLFPAFWVFAVQRRRTAVWGLSQFLPQRRWGCPLAADPPGTPAVPPESEKKHWQAAGGTQAGRDARAPVIGLLFGAAVFAAILALYHAWLKPAGLLAGAGGNIGAKLAGFGLEGPAAFVVLAACYSLIHSFLEEYYWRWFAFGQLRRWAPLWPAIVISALGFTGHHVVVLAGYFGGPTWPTFLFSAGVAVGGAFWAWLYARSGSLLGPWLSHVLIDAAIFAVGWDMVG